MKNEFLNTETNPPPIMYKGQLKITRIKFTSVIIKSICSQNPQSSTEDRMSINYLK
jgi:hypothetical protein